MLLRALVLPALLLASLQPVGAKAAILNITLTGTGLSVDTPCARHVEISPDSALVGQVTVQADADHQQEIDRLVLESGGSVRIHTRPGSCWQLLPGATPTLVLMIRVPPSFAVAVDESGAGTYTIGAVGGPLTLDVSGAAEITAARATTLVIDLSGSGALRVAQADGDAKLDLSGRGSIWIGQAAMPKLIIGLSGAGELAVDAGHIGSIRLDSSGVGKARIGAVVDDAHVDLSGVGSVQFARITGELRKDVGGVGSVTVGH